MFAYKFKELRLQKNLTQKELAKALCVSQSTIAFYENNKKHPTIDNLKRIARFFAVDISYFLHDVTEIDQKSNGNGCSCENSSDLLYKKNKQPLDWQLVLNSYIFNYKGQLLSKSDIKQLLHFSDFLLHQKKH